MTNVIIGETIDKNIVGGIIPLDKDELNLFNERFIKECDFDISETLELYNIKTTEIFTKGSKDKRIQNIIAYILYDRKENSILLCGEENETIICPKIFFEIKLTNISNKKYIEDLDKTYDSILNTFLMLLKNEKKIGKPIYLLEKSIF